MNKKIKELAEQAGPNTTEELKSDRTNVYVIDVKKFAELIIRECAVVALREDHEPYECILKHFDIEVANERKD